MGVGMERSAIGHAQLPLHGAVACSLCCRRGASAQSTPPEPPAIGKECGEARFARHAAAQQRHRPAEAQEGQDPGDRRILVGGARAWAATAVRRCWSRSWSATIKGLDVEIINRGFSGELAEAAGERLKIEVALNHPDIVLWQVGTNDAFAQVPVESFQLSVSNTVRWLKEHNVDVILVGLHYIKQLAKDEHYQAIRASLQRIATRRTCCASGATRPWRCWRAPRRRTASREPQDFGLSETGYNCMAQYIARTITVGLFARPPRQTPQGLPPPEPNNQPVPGGQPSDQQK